MIHYLIILLTAEKVDPGICQHITNSIDSHQLFFLSLSHRRKIIFKPAAQHLCIGKSDARDSKTVYDTGQGCFGGLFYGCNQIVIGLLTEAIHGHDFLLIPIEMEYIGIFMDKADADHLLQRRLGKAADIQCVTAGKERKALYLLCLTIRICAVQRFYIVNLSDFRVRPADGAVFWYVFHSALSQIFRNLGDNHIGLVNGDLISHSQLQRLHDT